MLTIGGHNEATKGSRRARSYDRQTSPDRPRREPRRFVSSSVRWRHTTNPRHDRHLGLPGRTAAPDRPPKTTTPGRFEGSPDWQSQMAVVSGNCLEVKIQRTRGSPIASSLVFRGSPPLPQPCPAHPYTELPTPTHRTLHLSSLCNPNPISMSSVSFSAPPARPARLRWWWRRHHHTPARARHWRHARHAGRRQHLPAGHGNAGHIGNTLGWVPRVFLSAKKNEPKGGGETRFLGFRTSTQYWVLEVGVGHLDTGSVEHVRMSK